MPKIVSKHEFSNGLRRKIILILLLSMFLPVFTHGQVIATKIKETPTFNGKLSDPCWKKAVPYNDFYRNAEKGEKSKNKTTAMVLFDDTALYIGIRCEDPEIANIKREKTAKDGNIYSQDCVEIMLDPSKTQSRYYHFMVSANGDKYDEFTTQGGILSDVKWNGQWDAKVFVGKDSWTCEIKIPFFNFAENSNISNDWGINICRGKRSPNEDSSIAENGVYGNAGSFLLLKGLNVDFSRYQLALKKPSISMKVIENNKIEVTICSELSNGTDKEITANIDGWLISPSGKTICAQIKRFNLKGKGILDVILAPVFVAEQGEYTCAVRSTDGNDTTAYQETQVNVRYAPVRILLIEPWYRHSIFETQKLEKITFDVALDMNPDDLKGNVLEISIKDKDKTVWSSTVNTLEKINKIEIPNSELPYGRFKIFAELKDRKGKSIEFGNAEFPLWKLPYKKGEVWLGKDKNWYVDGKPFYINTVWDSKPVCTTEHTAYMSMKNIYPEKPWISSNVIFKISQDKAARESHKEKYLSDETREKYRSIVKADKDTPNLFAYYLMDEPPGHAVEPEALRQAYEILKEEDPYHPAIVSDDKMPNTVKHLKCCDIQAYHPYPPMLSNKPVNDSTSISIDADEVNRHLKGQYHKVSLVFMHMGFNIRDYGLGPKNARIGSYDEFRGQAIMALASGIKGFFPYNRNVQDYPETLIGFPYLTKELSYFEKAVLAPESEIIPKASVDSVKILLKKVGNELILFTSNVSNEKRKITFTLPELPASIKVLNVVSENRSVPIINGAFSDDFDICEGHVYTTDTAPKLKSVKEIKDEIETAYKKRQKERNLFYQRNADDTVVVTASSVINTYNKQPDSTLWHVADGYIPSVDNGYGFMYWSDKTPNLFPDWLEIKMKKPAKIGRIEIYPMAKSLKDYKVQAWLDDKWVDVAEVNDQNTDHITHTFPQVQTDKIRIWVTATNGANSKITEIEAYEK